MPLLQGWDNEISNLCFPSLYIKFGSLREETKKTKEETLRPNDARRTKGRPSRFFFLAIGDLKRPTSSTNVPQSFQHFIYIRFMVLCTLKQKYQGPMIFMNTSHTSEPLGMLCQGFHNFVCSSFLFIPITCNKTCIFKAYNIIVH